MPVAVHSPSRAVLGAQNGSTFTWLYFYLDKLCPVPISVIILCPYHRLWEHPQVSYTMKSGISSNISNLVHRWNLDCEEFKEAQRCSAELTKPPESDEHWSAVPQYSCKHWASRFWHNDLQRLLCTRNCNRPATLGYTGGGTAACVLRAKPAAQSDIGKSTDMQCRTQLDVPGCSAIHLD